jgi:hypothetical protein
MRELPNPTPEALLEEYRQMMESQRDNTRIAYSWVGNVFLVLSGGLYFFGVSSDEMAVFIPTMVFGISLSVIWWAVTEVFARYTRERISRARQIEEMLGLRAMTDGTQSLYRSSWKGPFLQARTYVVMFVVIYIVVWVLALVMRL